MMREPSSRATVRVLTAGTLVSVSAFVVSFVLGLAGLGRSTQAVAYAAIVVLLATPAAGLLATVLETRTGERWTALAAVLVLAILGIATAVAVTVQK